MNVGNRNVRRRLNIAGAGLSDQQLQLTHCHRVAERTDQPRMIEPAAKHGADWRMLACEQTLLLSRKVALGRKADDLDHRLIADGRGQLVARSLETFELCFGSNDGDHRALGLPRDACGDAAEQAPHRCRKQRREQEKDEGLGQHGRREIAARDHERGAEKAHHWTFSWAISAAALSPAIATNASWRPGRSIARVSIPAPPSVSSNTHSSPSRRAFDGIAERHEPSLFRVRRRTIGLRRDRASSTPPSNTTLPLAMIATCSHNRSAWAMT